MNKLLVLISVVALVAFHDLKAQTPEEQSVKKALNVELGQTSGETAINVAKTLLGKPYVGQTLEKTPEKLVCNLREFDCYTLVENVVALTRMNNFNLSDYTIYQEMLTSMRYRDGKLDGYASRIHYFTEWIEQAENNGIITDLTKSWGKASHKKLDFMSKHPNYYPAMTDTKVKERISRMESYVNQSPFFEILKADFYKVESKIKNGDIIVFTSTIAGLDVNHEGLAYWQNGKLHLLHASLDYKRVMISPETLGEYLQKIPKHQGIMVLRLL